MIDHSIIIYYFVFRFENILSTKFEREFHIPKKISKYYFEIEIYKFTISYYHIIYI